MEEQMNMVEVLSEELGEKELKIMKLEEENKKLKENLMNMEISWLLYWSGGSMGEEAYTHPEWWQEELEGFDSDDYESDWKSHYPEMYDFTEDFKDISE